MVRRLTLLAIVVALTGLMAAPAAADDPTWRTITVTFDDIDPCSGEPHTVTVTIKVSIHIHDGTVITREHRTGTTTSGYTLDDGNGLFIQNGNNFTGHYRYDWRNAETEREFQVAQAVRIVEGQTIVNNSRFQCKGSRTILPGRPV